MTLQLKFQSGKHYLIAQMLHIHMFAETIQKFTIIIGLVVENCDQMPSNRNTLAHDMYLYVQVFDYTKNNLLLR